MSNTTPPVTLYGVPFSQPVRAVMWLMLYKRMPFEMVLINPGSKGDTGSRNPAYLAKNPGGTIPTNSWSSIMTRTAAGFGSPLTRHVVAAPRFVLVAQ